MKFSGDRGTSTKKDSYMISLRDQLKGDLNPPTHIHTQPEDSEVSYTDRPSLVLSIPQFYQLKNDHVHG